MPKQAIVQQNAIEIKKKLLGGIALHFNCPVCNEGLETNEADAISGEMCPTCSTRLLFDAAITDQIKQRILKNRSNKKKKQERNLQLLKPNNSKNLNRLNEFSRKK